MNEHEIGQDPAPALSRGIALVRRLDAEGPARLEDLVRATALPRSSLARLLISLQRLGLVRQDGLRWAAAVRLVPTLDGDVLRRWRPSLAALSKRHQVRAELYRAEHDGVTLIDLHEPERFPARIWAHIGWWPDPDELFAPMVVWRAWRPPRRARGGWYWRRGERHRLTTAQVTRWLARVRSDGVASCPTRNANGIRRIAAPLFHDQRLVGVLAVARFCLDEEPLDAALIAALRRECR